MKLHPLSNTSSDSDHSEHDSDNALPQQVVQVSTPTPAEPPPTRMYIGDPDFFTSGNFLVIVPSGSYQYYPQEGMWVGTSGYYDPLPEPVFGNASDLSTKLPSNNLPNGIYRYEDGQWVKSGDFDEASNRMINPTVSATPATDAIPVVPAEDAVPSVPIGLAIEDGESVGLVDIHPAQLLLYSGDVESATHAVDVGGEVIHSEQQIYSEPATPVGEPVLQV